MLLFWPEWVLRQKTTVYTLEANVGTRRRLIDPSANVVPNYLLNLSYQKAVKTLPQGKTDWSVVVYSKAGLLLKTTKFTPASPRFPLHHIPTTHVFPCVSASCSIG